MHALALPLPAAPLCANHHPKSLPMPPSTVVSSPWPLTVKLGLSCPRASYLYIGSCSQVQKSHLFKVRAVPSPAVPDHANSRGLFTTVQLGAMFGLWFLLNIYFNIFNKQVLKICPFPATVTMFQFGCGTLMITIMWVFNLHKRPKLTRSQLAAVILLAIGHTFGNLLTNVSLAKVNVSFTHTIKALEPFFTVLFSALILGEQPAFWVVASLMPIVGGVALVSFTEASFNWIGFSSAMASNVTNQSRNVLSKKLMVRKEEALDNINLFSVITVLSFIFLVPVALVLEGARITPYLHSAASQRVREVFIRSIAAGVCLHSYQQVSYMILEKVSAVTHSVANCLKRVVVIVTSVIFFQTPVSPVNTLGKSQAYSVIHGGFVQPLHHSSVAIFAGRNCIGCRWSLSVLESKTDETRGFRAA